MGMFNTLRATRTLTEAGIEQAHAEAIVSTWADEFVTDRIATKEDLRDLEQRLTIRMGALLATGIGLLLAAIGVATGVLATCST